MIMMRKLALGLVATLALVAAPAAAQTQKAFVVASCGSVSYDASFDAVITMDTAGRICTGTTGSETITSVVPGTGATNLGKAEDAAAASGDTGVSSLAVQQASPQDDAADGDYANLKVSSGRLWVSGVVTSVVPGVAATSLGKAEDAVAASGDTGVAVYGIQTATPANTAAEGDYVAPQFSAGRLWTSAVVTGNVSLATQGYGAEATFTPAASSHTAGDANGVAGTFSAIGPASAYTIITCAYMEIDGATAEATQWRLYLYNVTPPSATADDGAWDLPSGDRTAYLGYVDLGTAIDLGSTQWVETCGINKQVLLAASGNLFGYLVNATTLTPAAVAHIVKLRTIAP